MSSATLLAPLEGPELPIHPWTGLRAVGVLPSGRVVWPILGGSEPPGGVDGGDDGDDGDDDGDDDGGQQQQQAPAYTPPATQEELDKLLAKRVAQVERRYKGFDEIKAKAEQYDTLAAASQTDQERAVAEAEEAAYNAAMAKAVPKVVRAEFRAQGLTAGLDKAQLDALLEDLDLTRYADDEGEPDEKKIGKKIAALAPRQREERHDFGQGNRGRQTKGKDMNAAIRDLAGVN